MKNKNLDKETEKMFKFINKHCFDLYNDGLISMGNLVRMSVDKCFSMYFIKGFKIPEQIFVFREWVQNFNEMEFEKNKKLLNSLPENFWNK